MTKLELLLQVRDEVSKTVDKLSKKLGGLGSKLGSAIRKGALVGGAALAGLAVAAVKFGGDFNAAFNTIAQGTGATGEALKGLKGDFKAVLAGVPDDMGKVSSAIADVNTMLGLSGEPLQAVTKQFLDLARVAGVDSAALIDKAGKAFNIFGLDAEGGTAALDSFFKISQDSGLGIDKMTDSLQTFGPILSNAGFSIEESAALFGKLNKAGVDASRVMPAINAATRKMAAEGVTDLKGGLSDTIEKIRDATSTTEALSLATDVFGSEGAQRMVSAVREGGLAIDELAAAALGAEGKIADTAKATETMGQKFSRMKNTVLVALEPLLTKLFDGIMKAVDALIPMVQEFSEDHIPNIVRAVQGFARDAKPVVEAFLGAFTSGLDVILPLVKDLVRFIVSNKPVMIAALAAIGVAILVAFGPGAVAIAAIVGLIALIGLIKDNWDELKAKTEAIWSSLPGPIQTALEIIQRVIQVVFDNIVERVKAAMDIVKGIIKVVTGIIRGDWDLAWSGIRQAFGGFLDGLIAMVRLPLDILTAIFGTSVDEVVGFFGSLPGRVVDALGDIVEKVRKPFDDIARVIGDVWSGIKQVTEGVWGGIWSAIKVNLNAIIGLVNKFLGVVGAGINFAASIDPFGVIDKVDFKRVPELASGVRNFRGGLAVVGEDGPEIVGLPRGSSVFSNRESQQMGGGTNIYIVNNIEGSIKSDDDLVEIIMDSLRRGGLGGLPA